MRKNIATLTYAIFHMLLSVQNVGSHEELFRMMFQIKIRVELSGVLNNVILENINYFVNNTSKSANYFDLTQ